MDGTAFAAIGSAVSVVGSLGVFGWRLAKTLGRLEEKVDGLCGRCEDRREDCGGRFTRLEVRMNGIADRSNE